ncbi:LamB/YcsF family protein [Streptomyces sp. NBC_01186]|uniref:5-oxoprolinase subunit PxpA n=1 Tax=Streptomyces sp. NBC_01775 TaxID=2975939 RepID=UPI002DD8410D|nr:5-oxoprolinase subunit PxpA [Streptomyces sp. NBC_01775]WSB81366.1 LamB/YcsF family protein [Streptomyces sp. NBC_01775]WSS17883.1 LamB/YcsF family protein [Streptomyces sp. NBC_01186]
MRADTFAAANAAAGFPDLNGFGRRAMDLSYDEVRTDTLYQVGALDAFARAGGGRLSHILPHGRLGNLVVTDSEYARAVTDAVAAYDDDLIVVTQEGELARTAREIGLKVGIMFLADRGYEDDGTLVRRTEPGALIHDADTIAERTVRMATEGVVTSIHGTDVHVDCDVVLLHGDHPEALANGRALRTALESAGVRIAPLRTVLHGKDRETTEACAAV